MNLSYKDVNFLSLNQLFIVVHHSLSRLFTLDGFAGSALYFDKMLIELPVVKHIELFFIIQSCLVCNVEDLYLTYLSTFNGYLCY